MRSAKATGMEKLIKKAKGEIKNTKGLLSGRERGGVVVMLVVIGFLVVSVVTMVVVKVQAATEANPSSSSAWEVVDQQNEPIDTQLYDAQNTAGQQPLTAGSDPDNNTKVCPIGDSGTDDGTCGGCTDKCSL